MQTKINNIGAEILDNGTKLETLKKKMDRLGLVFADGTVSEEAYKSRVKQMKKQETTLIRCRKNIDPALLDELDNLERCILIVQEVINRGSFGVSPFGLFGTLNDEKIYIPIGYNALQGNDDRLEIGEAREWDYF